MPAMPEQSSTFLLELPLVTDDAAHRRLEKAFDFARNIYNATLGHALGHLQRMREDPRWRAAVEMDKADPERRNIFRSLNQDYGLTLNGLRTVANDHRKAARRDCLGAHEAQSIGKRVWHALERYMFRKGGRPRFKPANRPLNSVEGTDNHEIIWHPDTETITWRKHVYPVQVDHGNPYIEQALTCTDQDGVIKRKRVKFCRIVRKTFNGRILWYVQLALEGLPPVTHVYAPKSEIVAMDPGPSRAAMLSEHAAGLYSLAPSIMDFSREIRLTSRKMDRSRRAMNPENYEADGTCKKGRLQWRYSNEYRKDQARLRELHRRLEQTRDRDHGMLANHVLSLGGTVKVEINSYKSYQRGFLSKSTQKHAPGKFIARLKSKASSAGLEVVEFDPRTLRLSQYDPFTETYVKKPLKQRWHRLGNTNTIVQRDVFSAFLLLYAGKNGHNPELLREKWAAVEPLLRDAGLCRDIEPRNDQDWDKPLSRLTKEPEPQTLTPRTSGASRRSRTRQ